jgi:tRNA/tmRNA/rRNA uracil-C5-methylase (TrmA/RlmC/RlmD family)
MFAAQAGARKVYAVEASAAADVAEAIIAHNGFSDIIQLVRGKLEEIELPEKVS